MPACRIPAGWSLFWCNLPPTHAHTRRTRAPAPPPPPPSPTPAPPSVVYASYPHTAGVVRVGNRSFRPAPGLHDALAGPPPHPHPHARPPSPHVRRDVCRTSPFPFSPAPPRTPPSLSSRAASPPYSLSGVLVLAWCLTLFPSIYPCFPADIPFLTPALRLPPPFLAILICIARR
jgi:hypothetical protein